jgi:predicted transcriptional regulator
MARNEPTPVYSSTVGKREQIRSLVALLHGSPPRRLPRGEAKRIADQLGTSDKYVHTTVCEMRAGRLTDVGRAERTIGSLPERVQRLEVERPGLSRIEQARILGVSYSAVRQAAYILRMLGGNSPRRTAHKPTTRVATKRTGWTP